MAFGEVAAESELVEEEANYRQVDPEGQEDVWLPDLYCLDQGILWSRSSLLPEGFLQRWLGVFNSGSDRFRNIYYNMCSETSKAGPEFGVLFLF